MQKTVSTELLTIRDKRPLGPKLEVEIQSILDKYAANDHRTKAECERLSKIVSESTGINTRIKIVSDDTLNAGARLVPIEGHLGTDGRWFFSDPKAVTYKGEFKVDIQVDLDTGKVSGKLPDFFDCEIELNSGLFLPKHEITAEEVTAVLLHEIGHTWNQLMVLGDYILLNYFLQDGIEVIMGTKPNVYNLKVYTPETLAKEVEDPVIREQLLQDPTEANVRIAILSALKGKPRFFLADGDAARFMSIRREEQLADLFATRQGYARANATYQFKGDKINGERFLQSKFKFYLIETVSLILNILGYTTVLLYGVGFIFFYVEMWLNNHYTHEPLYDNPADRIRLTRQDAVAQLKSPNISPEYRKQLVNDVEIIDQILKEYNNYPTFWESLSRMFSKRVRDIDELRALEQNLATLMNNDLFITEQKFKQLLG